MARWPRRRPTLNRGPRHIGFVLGRTATKNMLIQRQATRDPNLHFCRRVEITFQPFERSQNHPPNYFVSLFMQLNAQWGLHSFWRSGPGTPTSAGVPGHYDILGSESEVQCPHCASSSGTGRCRPFHRKCIVLEPLPKPLCTGSQTLLLCHSV